MSNFKKDLERGIYYEKKAINILKLYGFKQLERVEGYNIGYDIKGTYKKQKVTIEVKYNKNATYTGLFFIEVAKKDLSPSGLSATTADYYILFNYFDCWILRTVDLQEALEQYIKKIIKRRNPTRDHMTRYIIENGTYTTNTLGILLPIKIIEKYALFIGAHKIKKIK